MMRGIIKDQLMGEWGWKIFYLTLTLGWRTCRLWIPISTSMEEVIVQRTHAQTTTTTTKEKGNQ